MKNTMSPLLNVMHLALKNASKFLIRDFNELGLMQSSKSNNQRSYAIKTLNGTKKSLCFELSKAKPNSNIYMPDENGNIELVYDALGKDDLYFTVILMDGFDNFCRAIPLFSNIVIAKFRKNKNMEEDEIAAIVIDFPMLKEYYYTSKGAGAWKGAYADAAGSGNRMRVSSRSSDLLMATSIQDMKYRGENTISLNCQSLDVSYLISGKLDSVLYKKGNIIMDMLSMIVIEAGGGISEAHDNIILHNTHYNN